ncbi:histone deacetylase 6-like isoform X5 [Acropora millepora]|uniref:histone deacetylase 6-like isoform X5 n=1 Tax=Acropora millepora TaxID=45264 RepID=UPI001CF33D0E|nr:histone deacetylase 6-like isoform X5 [Acropora millepora]
MWDSTHPEVPDRIQRPYDKLKEYGLLERCQEITSRFVSDEELLSQHSTVHVNKMKSSKTLTTEELYHMGACDYDSVYMSQHACECACLASGCTLAATEAVVTDKVQNAVAIVRILIVDWDIHHGNGTQHLFESDPSVLYLSIHRFDNALFFPFSMEADYDFVGCGSGKGYTVNVLWNKVSLCNICTFSSSEKPVVAIVKKRAQNKAKHMGDADYLAVFHHILLPIAYEFDPELVLVSAGFDSARGDPKGQCDVTPEGYHHLTKLLMNLARGKIVVVLEGGYNLTSVEESICACTSLLGDPCPRLEGPLTPCNRLHSLK